MSRPVGVTASAIVAILGSIFAALVAAGMAATPFMTTPQPQPQYAAGMAIASAVMCVALAVLGIWTSVGLFRLRPWARTSILVFAGFAVAGSLFTLLVTMAVPLPPELGDATVQSYRRVVAVMLGVPLAIGVWWLIQFNTQSTKAAFASSTVEAAPSRPLSILVIAWASIVGAATCLFPIVARMPAFLFGMSFNGWIGGAIYAVFGAVSLYIGNGLLDLRERARVVAIGWFAFTVIHAGAVTQVPALRARLLESQRALTQNEPNPFSFDQAALLNLVFGFTAVVAAAGIWFLIRNRPAFARAAN